MGQFSSSRLKKKTQDPDSWISELELMRIMLKKIETPIDDEYPYKRLKIKLNIVSIKVEELSRRDSELWLGDARASRYLTNTMEGMKNLTKINTCIIFDNGKRLKATYVGEKIGTVAQRNGKRVSILMKNVKYFPKLYCNSFSISAALKKGCYLEGNLRIMKIYKSGREYVLDRHIKIGKGSLFAMKVTHKYKLETKKKEKWSILMKIHQELDIPSEDVKGVTGLKMKVKMKGLMQCCQGFGIGKTRESKMNKELVPRANKIGEGISMDISSIKHESSGGAKFWTLFIDDCSDFLINRLLKKLSDLAKVGTRLIKIQD